MSCPICPGCAGAYHGPARSGVTLRREAPSVIADKRYYVTADRSRVVDEDDPEAAALLAAEGDDIADADVERYGLGKRKAAPVEPMAVPSIAADPEPAEESVEEKPAAKAAETTDTKAVQAAPANKSAASRKADEDK